MTDQAGRSDEQRVLAVWPDTIVYFNKIMKRWLWWRESDPSRVSDHFDTEAEAWADAASRLPKEESVPDDCLDITDDGKVIIAAPPAKEPAPQTFEHPRADCEGCGDPNCPCNLIDADGFLEWWRDNNQSFEASDSFTHPIDYAAAAWNAAKASSRVGCHAPDYKVGGDYGTQQKTSDSEARNTAADRENLSSLSAEGSDVENIRQPPDSTDDRRQQMSILPIPAPPSPVVAGGESDLVFIGYLRRDLLMPYDCKWNGYVRDITAELESEGMLVSRKAVNERIYKDAAQNMSALELIKDVRGKE